MKIIVQVYLDNIICKNKQTGGIVELWERETNWNEDKLKELAQFALYFFLLLEFSIEVVCVIL